MRSADWYFDFISPFAYLQSEQLAALGTLARIRYRPILFAGLLNANAHKGPAEIPAKRTFTYRFVTWQAKRMGIPIKFPPEHPFNPLALLRLAYACAGPPGLPNRHVCRTILHHVWRGGGDPVDAARLAQLTQQLAPRRDPAGAEVKQALRASTDQAIGLGIFGVPTVQVEQRLFWGLDALEMVAASLRGDPWFDAGGGWDQAAAPRPGLQRAG